MSTARIEPEGTGRSAPSLQALFVVFARYGNLTFGGGSATIATLHGEIIERRSWISQHRFDLAYALSRLTPGTNLIAFSTAIGWMFRGWAGAIITLLGGSIPCAVLAVIMTAFYELWSRNSTAQTALHGAIVAAVAVVIMTGVTILRPHWRHVSWLKLLLFVGASAAASLLSVSPIHILVIAALLGYFWPVAERHK